MATATAKLQLYSEEERGNFRRMTVVWGITVLLLLPVLALLGYFMRLFQSGAFPRMRAEWFYAVLTLHSLGMVGTWFVGSMAGLSYLLLKYTRPSLAVSKFNYWGTLLGVGLLIACTLGGLFGTGWYFLYPLPLYGCVAKIEDGQGTASNGGQGCKFKR
jgi:heme/copper-type cytochrome/quinol oxidase subunit 1